MQLCNVLVQDSAGVVIAGPHHLAVQWIFTAREAMLKAVVDDRNAHIEHEEGDCVHVLHDVVPWMTSQARLVMIVEECT